MRKIEPELITGMGYIGDNPGVLYRMGGAGEQTVVTGNPALLEGVKGSRFTSLAIHGKSTQGSTTGAQLFDKSKAFAGWVNSDGSINNAGTVGKGDNIVSEYIPFEAGKQYFCESNFVWIYNTEKGFVKKADTELKGGVFTSPDNAGFFVVAFSIAAESALAKFNKIMINVGSVKKPYEPYTGGAPSPSPSYPQEIESAGDKGNLNVMVRGKNIFPGPEQPKTVEKNGLTFSYKDGMYTLTGTSNENTWFNIYPVIDTTTSISPTHNGNTICSDGKIAVVNGLKNKLCNIAFREVDNKNSTTTITASNNKKMLQHNTSGVFIYAQPGSYSDTFTLMITDENQTEDYEPYHTPQTLTLSTPNGLPGIPVSSGGNYTDKDGQQWVADEIDLARGERVQWIGKYELTGKENVADFGLNPRTRMVSINIPDAYIDAGNHGYLKAVMSNKYKQAKCTELANNINLIARGQQRNICFSIPTDVGIEDFKTDLSNQYASGRPVKVFYKLATPIRTPLPPETIAAYKKLHTYSPTTTVINDAGAGMSVGYKRK